jgi:hypothetical protein
MMSALNKPNLKSVLLAVAGLMVCSACRSTGGGSGVSSAASLCPLFAREAIRKIERDLHRNTPATVFVGATASGKPFVAITYPHGSINGSHGTHVQESGKGKDAFYANPNGSLYIATKEGSVDVDSITPCRGLRSTNIIVRDEGITVDYDVMDVLVQKNAAGVWHASAVHCHFPSEDVPDEQLEKERLWLEKAGSGDIHFSPEHIARDDQYRRHLLSHVAAQHGAVHRVYESEETSDSTFLMNLLLKVMAHGIDPTFTSS